MKKNFCISLPILTANKSKRLAKKRNESWSRFVADALEGAVARESERASLLKTRKSSPTLDELEDIFNK